MGFVIDVIKKMLILSTIRWIFRVSNRVSSPHCALKFLLSLMERVFNLAASNFAGVFLASFHHVIPCRVPCHLGARQREIITKIKELELLRKPTVVFGISGTLFNLFFLSNQR